MSNVKIIDNKVDSPDSITDQYNIPKSSIIGLNRLAKKMKIQNYQFLLWVSVKKVFEISNMVMGH